MARSVRATRLKVADDLRDHADALTELLERAADAVEEAVGGIDSLKELAPQSVGRKRATATYEQLQERASVFGSMLPAVVRKIADAHLGNGDQAHDEETCVVCRQRRGELEKGWLHTLYEKPLRREIKRMVADGEIDVISDEQEKRIRSDERRRIHEQKETDVGAA